MNWGPILTTAGGLVFDGGTNDRMFRAFDAKTGEELWHFKTNSGVVAPPSPSRSTASSTSPCSPAGASTPPAREPDQQRPRRAVDVPQGGVIWVFALSQ